MTVEQLDPELAPRRIDRELVDAAAARRRPSAVAVAGAGVGAIVLVGAVRASELSVPAFVQGIPNIVDFLGRMYPPDFGDLGNVVSLMAETLAIALIGTILGTLAAVPIGLLAARNVSPHPVVYQATRLLVNLVRAVPELMWALLFVSAVGLGAFAGTMAITIGSAFGMGRLFSEIFEAADPRSLEAARGAGTTRLQRISWVLLPDTMPLLSSYTLLLFDSNVRAASLLGLVGAGGIGVELMTRLRLFEYQKVMTIVLVVLVVVTFIDRLSARIRRKLA